MEVHATAGGRQCRPDGSSHGDERSVEHGGRISGREDVPISHEIERRASTNDGIGRRNRKGWERRERNLRVVGGT